MASERITLTVPGPDGDREVGLSSPNRVLWPELGITKHELAEYLLAVSGPFLAANGDRPVSLERFPEGVDGERFYSKNPPKGAPSFVEAQTVTYNSGRRHPQLILTEIATAVWAVQMNTIVFHPWASLTANTDNPVELRIDLDPLCRAPDFADAAAVAPAMREVLAEAGLTTFVKTSGNRGIHVFCPIEPTHEFLDVRHAVIAAGRELERRMPDKVTMNWWKEERGERIFIDFNQANRDRTMAGAYSPRALPGATVSTPLTWDEVTDADPAAFTVRSVPQRLADVGDPWADLLAKPGRIDTLLEWWERDLVGRARRAAVPARLPEDARGAAARAAEPDQPRELGLSRDDRWHDERA